MSIPKKILQTWKSRTDIPANFQYWSQTWKAMNPDYEYILWDDADNRAFIAEHFAWFLPTFDAYPKNINRADAVRYFFLYYYGGIYADMDFECLKPMDSLIAANPSASVILGKMSSNTKRVFHTTNSIPNALMISAPRDPFWIFVIQQLIQSSSDIVVESATGPAMLYKAIRMYNTNCESRNSLSWYNSLLNQMEGLPPTEDGNLIIVAPQYLYPLSWVDNQPARRSALNNADYTSLTSISKKNYPEAYAVTYWTHTW